MRSEWHKEIEITETDYKDFDGRNILKFDK